MMKKRVILTIFLLLIVFSSAFGFETVGLWNLEHLYSQKFSIGTVRDLYPPTGEWGGDMLIVGIQFLNQEMAYLHCETPSGAQVADYPVFFTAKKMEQKTEITFRLENEEEIVFFVFYDDSGNAFFSYADAGPEPGSPSELKGSTDKIVFRNHFGEINEITD